MIICSLEPKSRQQKKQILIFNAVYTKCINQLSTLSALLRLASVSVEILKKKTRKLVICQFEKN
jgi:hypothetical protein